MARIRTSGASGSSENSIIFIPAGGHSHDGITSSLISTEKYSIYDFSPSFVNSTQSQTRAIRQESNRIAFESLVVNIVNQSVLVPAGIRLNPGTLNASAIIANTITAVHLAANTITADEIAANTITAAQIAANTITTNQIAANTITAGDIAANTITADQIASNTITADELVSNIILVNNIIRSNNYATGTGGTGGAGWRISNDGSAEFSNVVVRGNIFSNVGTIGGWTLSSNSLASGTGSTTLYSNGAAVIGNTTIAANGGITNGNFAVSNTGALTSTAGTIGGWTINSNSITGITAGGNTSTFSSVSSSLSLHGEYTSQYAYALVSPGYVSVYGELKTTQIRGNRIDTTDVYATNFFGTASSADTATSATTATNQSGGTVSATSVDSSGTITANNADFRRLGGTIATRTGVPAWWGSATDGGFLGKNASSSLRYKTDVTEVINPLLDPKKLLDVNIVQYRYKDGVLEEDDPNKGKYTIGFIAEDMYEKYQVGATIDEEGRPEAWNYNTIIPAMMSLIKDLNARIAELEAK